MIFLRRFRCYVKLIRYNSNEDISYIINAKIYACASQLWKRCISRVTPFISQYVEPLYYTEYLDDDCYHNSYNCDNIGKYKMTLNSAQYNTIYKFIYEKEVMYSDCGHKCYRGCFRGRGGCSVVDQCLNYIHSITLVTFDRSIKIINIVGKRGDDYVINKYIERMTRNVTAYFPTRIYRNGIKYKNMIT